MQSPHVLLATLGGQPQIVTFALDLLLAQDIPINEVIVIHPESYPRLEQSIEHLHSEFANDRYKFREQIMTIRFRRHVLRQHGRPIHDIVDEPTADSILSDIDELMRDRKQEQYIIHFCITGGRRLMSFFAFAAALLNFNHNDRLWHLYTPDAIREQAKGGTIMHVPPESGVRLIEVPFMRASQSVLAYRNHENPKAIIQTRNAQQVNEEQQRCDRVYKQATKRLQDTLRAIVNGSDKAKIALTMGISENTVNEYIYKLLGLCRIEWPDEPMTNYHDIHNKFRNYFSNERSIH